MSGWWALQDLNLGPTDYESAALTAELRARAHLSYTNHCTFSTEVPPERGTKTPGQLSSKLS